MPTSHRTPSRLESAVTVASIAALVIGIVSIALSLIVGMTDRFAAAEGFWPVVYGAAFFCLPIGFVLLAVSIVLAQRRRRLALHEPDAVPGEGGTAGA